MERYTIRAAGYLRALRELMADTATTSIANDDGIYPDAPYSVKKIKWYRVKMIFHPIWLRWHVRRWHKES